MDCATVQSKLADYLDGELHPDGLPGGGLPGGSLSGGERHAIQAHLAACVQCSAEWALLSEIDDAMATWPVLAEPEGLAAGVMDHIRRTAPRAPTRRAWPRVARWQDALLGLALAMTVVTLVLSVRYTWRAGIVELGALDLQVQHSLSVLERAWYAVRTYVGHVRADLGNVLSWASSAIVVVAAAVTAILLAHAEPSWKLPWASRKVK